MTIFTCNDGYEDMMTCIYDAWSARLGHNQIRLKAEPIGNLELFCEYRHIEKDPEKTAKVIRSIQKKISWEAYQMVYRCAMSSHPNKLDAIYRFLILGFAYGSSVTHMLKETAVITVFEINRRVANEAHLSIEFMRFSNTKENILVSHIEPKSNVLTLVAPYFSDRMPSENWMIVDDARSMAIVHPSDENYYLTPLTEKETLYLNTQTDTEDSYAGLWKEFFKTIGIEARKNYKCQRTMLPLWHRKNMTEFR